jgi:hypothetical protein
MALADAQAAGAKDPGDKHGKAALDAIAESRRQSRSRVAGGRGRSFVWLRLDAEPSSCAAR